VTLVCHSIALTYILTYADKVCRVTCVMFQSSVRVPWLSFAKCVPLYALAVAHFTFNWGYYTLLTCLPQYFKHILRFDIKSVSILMIVIIRNWFSLRCHCPPLLLLLLVFS